MASVVKMFGGIAIVGNVKFYVNAVVSKSFPEGYCTLVGVLACPDRKP